MYDYVATLQLDMERFDNWLLYTTTLKEILSPPLLREPVPFIPVKETIVVGETTHYGSEQRALPQRTKPTPRSTQWNQRTTTEYEPPPQRFKKTNPLMRS
jgi:hypothetical protein